MRKLIQYGVVASVLLFSSTWAAAEPLLVKTVEQVFAEQKMLSGKRVVIEASVTKVNNNIMGKNFLHIQDGTGTEGANNLTVTSQQMADVGDKLRVEALVTIDRDFGHGYLYPLILEEAVLTPISH